MNFSQPGGATLSAVELPGGLYPGTDFASGFFNASVAPKLTEEQCNEFASPEAAPSNQSSDSNSTSNSTSKDANVSDTASTAKPASPSKVKIGNTEFSELETISGDDKQADAKYYHVYKNGNCYEFTLGMQTASIGDDETVTPVNRSQVFHKLEWILGTVKITSPETQETTPVQAATSATSGAATPGTVASAAPATAPVKVIDDRQ